MEVHLSTLHLVKERLAEGRADERAADSDGLLRGLGLELGVDLDDCVSKEYVRSMATTAPVSWIASQM